MAKLRINIPYKIISVFGNEPVGDNGKDEVIYYCPECINRRGRPDTKGKLYVNTKSYKYICFLCGYSGKIGHVKTNNDKVYDSDRELEVESLIHDINEVNNGKDKFSLKIPIEKVFESDSAVKYLKDRGFTEDQMEYYDMRIGNLNQEFGRIIIPNQVKKIVYTDFYSARTFIDQIPKYHNPGIEKSGVVFNLHRIKEGEPIIVVEGALTAVAAGYHAVATLGKTMTRTQASLILSKHPSIIYVNYDYDAESYLVEACKLLRSIDKNVKIMQVFMKDERDAADLSHEEYAKCLSEAVEYNPLYEDMNLLIN